MKKYLNDLVFIDNQFILFFIFFLICVFNLAKINLNVSYIITIIIIRKIEK